MNGKLLNDKGKLIKRYYSNRISMKAVQGKRKRKTEATHSKKRRGKVKEKQAMRLIGRTWTASIGLPVKLSF
jgi:hypothetical protein